MDELIDTVETVEIVDGVHARLLAPPSVIETEVVSDSIVDGGEGVAACVVGVAPLVGEMFVGVLVVKRTAPGRSNSCNFLLLWRLCLSSLTSRNCGRYFWCSCSAAQCSSEQCVGQPQSGCLELVGRI